MKDITRNIGTNLTESQRRRLVACVARKLTRSRILHSDEFELVQREAKVKSLRIISWLNSLPIEEAEYLINSGWKRVMDDFKAPGFSNKTN